MLVVCGSSLLWKLLPLSGVGQVACQSFLVREACVSLLVDGAGIFCLECNEVSHRKFWGICGFGVTLDSLYFNAQGYVPALLEN